MSIGGRDGDNSEMPHHHIRLTLSVSPGGENCVDESEGDGENIDPAAGLPHDPRNWTSEQVGIWVQRWGQKYNIENLDLRRFHMNGRGLCLMTISGFNYRVPGNGEQMYLDFRSLLANV
ncbi:ets DNA-binding protein pokkuri-like [Corticium candelabrum]|uniref:ets DNA-binding protein pokkuri-like n=1 Tax=Corticium candelabrum TaxID=121492 RepID=UPI002E25FC7B|nr:ets DNA-binding protein pokkuri-like [Corticium candelabrum]XP_062512844.1 ets DNA-binding protein pokkuri-like [Corticium candelabrum]XP_062512845.1 ets DNA-binding protein pokkuri-like [Corticium candelabrum]